MGKSIPAATFGLAGAVTMLTLAAACGPPPPEASDPSRETLRAQPEGPRARPPGPNLVPCPPTAPDGFGGHDECATDADCPGGGICSCAGSTFGFSHVTHDFCVPAECHSGADCASGVCAATLGGCGPFYGIEGYYCRTAADSCTSDAQCSDPSGAGYCAYAPELGLWACSHAFCAG